MPRGFDAREQKEIIGRLYEAGEEAFSRTDFAKVSVDELVGPAGISKGAFYRFFESKEHFYFALTQQVEVREKQRIAVRLERAWDELSLKQALEYFFLWQFELIEQHPLFERALDPALLERIIRKLGRQAYQERMAEDEAFWKDWIGRFAGKGMVQDEAVLARAFEAVKNLIYLVLHRRDIGPGWKNTLVYLVDRISEDLLPKNREE
ncbi:TetR/AcrR family transcriptional regulator [Spirochaeta lutea]|uniref:HTH tetR-type domain-containing protein n=1 Tax=Spirochaeta lutea TaxID=1480694 RepID=A0A098QTP6_9SPIO|nr:TetR/AcrR family transcriptional regulator [Spirochaeta lutea]KGE70936.1 hypothetical protein DC28_13415 [Spirochaeta lutea]